MATPNPPGPRSSQTKLAQEFQTALAHHQAGRIDRAETLYRKILDKTPDHADALNLLGVIALARGRPERAMQLIGRAVQLMPDFADAHLNLGNAQRLAGKTEQAVASYRRAIALKPGAASAHNNLARLLNDLQQFDLALESCATAIRLDPHLPAARINRAVALQGLGRLPEAAPAWRDAIATDPARAESFHALALLLRDREQCEEALPLHDRAVALRPDSAIFQSARGDTLVRMKAADAAAESFRRAVTLAPDLVEAWRGLDWALRRTGRFDEAETCFKRLRALDPGHVDAYRHVTTGGDAPDVARELQHLAMIRDRQASTDQDRIAAGFGLGRLLDDAGDFDEAFANYRAANALVRHTWPAGADRFDAATFSRWVDLLIETYPPDHCAGLGGSGSDLPVFIVGMPRSGTTLVEQICASHSRVFGAGELHDIDRIATALTGGRDGRIEAREGDADSARTMADAHIERLRRMGGDAVRVIDKMPDNILQVGLIATLFPGARIILCTRDARDIAVSCYFQLFAAGLMFFSYDLGDCGRRCRDVGRLTAHWARTLPARTITVGYESLVADLEGESRRLIEFLGLDWERACLEFHRTDRTVTTASHWQVRQPLYSRSVGRWRHYEAHLGPLFAGLRDAAS